MADSTSGMLEIVLEEKRRPQHDGDAAERAARRDGEIELRQARRLRLQSHHFRVADHAAREQRRRLQHQRDEKVREMTSGTGSARLVPASSRNAATEQHPVVGPRITEGDHERQQIRAERDDPQERHHRRPLRDGIGGRDQQGRSECRIEHPHRQRIAVACRKRTRIGDLRVRRAADREHTARRKQRRIQHVGPGPPARLLQARQQPLEEERIGEQAQERADIRGGKEPHRIEIGRDMRKPARKQRRRRGQRDIGQADAHRQQSQDAPRGIARICRLPVIGGRDRQQQQGQNKEADLQLGLPVDGQGQRDRIGVRIAHQQRHLEEQHAHEPGRRAAPNHGRMNLPSTSCT